jgi:hypothetical protein
MFTGCTSGNQFEGTLPKSGDMIRVYTASESMGSAYRVD